MSADLDANALGVLLTTLEVAAGAVALAAPPALALGYLLARREFRGKSLVETAVSVPLVLPPTAIGYLLLTLLGRDGWLGPRALGFDPDLLFSARGAVLASACVSFPLVARSARAAFEGVDARLELLARTHGCSALGAFARVTLPLASRGLLAAGVLGFGRALGEFGATVIVAGNIPGRTQTLALAIFSEIQLGDTRRALGFVGLALALAFALMFAAERLARPRARRLGASASGAAAARASAEVRP